MVTMASLNAIPDRTVLPPAARRHRFTVHQYERISDLFEDRGVEKTARIRVTEILPPLPDR
jgi:hypothetical protein